MITVVISLVAFTALVIIGVHATTRPGMLLAAFGQQVSEESALVDLDTDLVNDLLKAQEDFLEDVENILASDDKNTRFEIIDLSIKYICACDERKAMHDEDTFELEESFDGKSRQPIRRLLRPISTPLTECTTCMSSVWSIAVFGAYLISPYALVLFVPFAVAGSIQIIESLKTAN